MTEGLKTPGSGSGEPEVGEMTEENLANFIEEMTSGGGAVGAARI